MNTLTKLCAGCKGGMPFASYVNNRGIRVTGFHCLYCSTVTERFGTLDVVRAA